MSARARTSEEQVDTAALLKVLVALRDGDFSARLPSDWTGIAGKVADTLNEVIAANQRQMKELERIGRVVGKEGRTHQRIPLGGANGGWADSIRSVNDLIEMYILSPRDTSGMGPCIPRPDAGRRG